MNKLTRFITSTVLIGAAFLLALASGQGQQQPQQEQAGAPIIRQEIKHDVSLPLRDIARPPQPRLTREAEPVRRLPVQAAKFGEQDSVVQAIPGPLVGTTAGLNFAGVGNGDYGFTPDAAPPDTNGAVGATQFVQWVNESFAVFDKTTGTKLLGPVAGNSLWSGFGGGCQTNNDGDIIVKYDQINNRWIFTQFSVSTTPYLECVAVSTTSDATGSYNRYSFNYGSTEFPDYPKLGVWPDAYYISFNMISLEEIDALAPERICISPGPCTPREAGISKDVILEFGARTPILGVCLGHQCIAEAYGGEIVRASRLMHGKASTITHDGNALFSDLDTSFEAGRYHSLVVKRTSLPGSLEITAESDDGEIMRLVCCAGCDALHAIPDSLRRFDRTKCW